MSPVLSDESTPVNSFAQGCGDESKPMFKILKRPADIQNDKVKVDRAKVPVKSLEQRELEYAQARLRILGSDSHGQMDNGRTSNRIHSHFVHRTNADRPTRITKKPNGFLMKH